ncbi:MAG TPA: hypothetical protein VMV91_15445 [Rhodocyclaceae bacterium]|nr:hypothetical protein [Rhodocyclaceae bacterium]
MTLRRGRLLLPACALFSAGAAALAPLPRERFEQITAQRHVARARGLDLNAAALAARLQQMERAP